MSDRKSHQQSHESPPLHDGSSRSPTSSSKDKLSGEKRSEHSSPSSASHLASGQPKKRPRQKWRRQLRYFYIRFVRMRGTPKAIARGLAAGVFAGWFPLFGLQTIIGVAIASIVRGNKIMAAAGTWVSNPLTYVPIYYFNFRIGQGILSQVGVETEMPSLDEIQAIVAASGWSAFSDFLNLGFTFAFTLFLGCFVIGIISALLAYVAGIKLAQFLRRRKSRSSQ